MKVKHLVTSIALASSLIGNAHSAIIDTEVNAHLDVDTGIETYNEVVNDSLLATNSFTDQLGLFTDQIISWDIKDANNLTLDYQHTYSGNGDTRVQFYSVYNSFASVDYFADQESILTIDWSYETLGNTAFGLYGLDMSSSLGLFEWGTDHELVNENGSINLNLAAQQNYTFIFYFYNNVNGGIFDYDRTQTSSTSLSFSPANAISEPFSVGLFALGLLGFGFRRANK